MSFATAFRALTGHDPFPWQTRLFDRFRTGDVPRAIDIPTGLGKTNVMSLWLLAVVGGAPLPRRLVYVVDRRAVVDQASLFAQRLASAELMERHDRLRVSTLRGSLADNRVWLEDPSAPALVVGTVDMIGSRLLFAGYGVSRRMRPFHAGLLGNDTLVVLDEAHLSQPFAALVEGVESMTAGSVRLLALSATGRAAPDFALDADDLAHPGVAARVHAHKGIVFEDGAGDPKAIASRALSLVADSPARIAVFLTSRDLARRVADELTRRKATAILLVGERRGRERDAVAEKLEASGFIGDAGPAATSAFVVATAAGEVGIDLDADHMVADLVPFERIVQRLGRVNRRGRDGHRAAAIVIDSPAKIDPAELSRRQLTRALLSALPAPDGVPIAGPANLAALREREADRVAQAGTPTPLHPPLTRALVEALSMTSLAEHTGRPDVAPWLRGWVDEPPQTAVVWRAHLPVVTVADAPDAPIDVADFFADAPPHVSERLEAETTHVVEWLTKRVRAKESDGLPPNRIVGLVLDNALELYDPDRRRGTLAPGALTLARLRSERPRDRDDLVRTLAGRTLVVRDELAGLSQGLLDPLADEPPATADDGGGDWPGVAFRVLRRAVGDPPKGRVVRNVVVRRSESGEPLDILAVVALKGEATGENSRSVAPAPVTLSAHTADVVAAARQILDRLDLPDAEKDAILLAAELHDCGKAADVWQRAMNAPAGGHWAKTTGGGNLKALSGYRHEFGSLLAAEVDAAVAALPPELADLVLHLVAAHHGNARPVIAADGCTEGPPSALAARAGDAARRFARLTQRYGPWGLAFRETLLRAADQAASGAEARGAGDGDE